jgi:peroxiredoxin
MFCREQAVHLHREKKAIEKKGAQLVFVGNGNKAMAAAFRDQFEITSPLYVDTKRASYAALDFGRNPLSLATTGAAKAAARALGEGFRQGLTQGDAWQLGGVVVVKKDGSVPFRYASKHPGDHPAVEDVVAAL